MTLIYNGSTPEKIIYNENIVDKVYYGEDLVWQAELPSSYKRLLGFSMNDNCYFTINNFYMQGSDTLRFSFSISAPCNILGAYIGTGSSDYNYSLYVATGSNAKYLRYYNDTYNSQALIDKRYDIIITPTGSSGMENDSTWEPQTFTTSKPLRIGTTSDTATSAKLIGSLYGNIEVDGRLKLIPCERLSDNVLGYYDTYSETFFTPSVGTPTSLGDA